MKKKCLYIFISGILIWNCASIKSPPGGPIDEIPPTIIDIQPKNGTINMVERKIAIQFSEYMNESSFKNNISILPKLEYDFKYKFKGDEIVLSLPKSLDSSKTYIIQLNRNITDEHGVPLAKPIQLAYSTGSRISKSVIEGKVYGNEQSSLHLWKINGEGNDSLFATLPDYITDADINGFFSFSYLSSGNYIILSVDKNFAEMPLNTMRSAYGIYWQNSIALAEEDTVSNVNMRMWKKPQKLKLLNGEWSQYGSGNQLPKGKPLFLRLTKKGVEYTGYYSPDGATWSKVGTHVFINLKGRPYFVAYNSKKDVPESGIKFDYFEIRKID